MVVVIAIHHHIILVWVSMKYFCLHSLYFGNAVAMGEAFSRSGPD